VEIEKKIRTTKLLHMPNFETLDWKFKKIVINGVAYIEIGYFRGKIDIGEKNYCRGSNHCAVAGYQTAVARYKTAVTGYQTAVAGYKTAVQWQDTKLQ
jgi:hypothetical protein